MWTHLVQYAKKVIHKVAATTGPKVEQNYR